MSLSPTVALSPCPNPETLERLLRDELSLDETSAVEGHVGVCTDCQRVLKQLIESLPDVLGALADAREGCDDDPPELPGYELMGRIDAGGMGVVWRVRELAFQRTLAVKVMKAETGSDPNLLRRFPAEARITGQLAHPSIVPVHAKGQLADGRPYFAMKLVEGETLAARLRRTPAGAPRLELVRVFAQICQAVAYAHACGVIHRDLKPSNVMVGAFGEVQVMDWGLAKVVSEKDGTDGALPPVPGEASEQTMSGCHTRPGAVMGTLRYMPPEQARGEVDLLDPRCDVFNLGAILCEILTGAPPYRSASRDEVLRQAANGELADALARLDACGADAELVGLAKSCLVPHREGRPADAGAVAAAVVAHEENVEKR